MKNFIGSLVILALFCQFTHSTEVICYFTNWATYRTGIAHFTPQDIDPSLCTIINYAFVGLNGTTGELVELDQWSDAGLGNLKGVVGLKADNPKLKVLISMGGWTQGSENYSKVAADAALRANLVKSVLTYIQTNNFDGFDLDWEYPTARNGTSADRENYITLLSELKAAFEPYGYLLTVAVAGAGPQVKESYDIPKLAKVVDYIILMEYDLRTASNVNYTAHHAALYPSYYDVTSEQTQLTVQGGISQWLEWDITGKKLILGMAFYGKTFELADPTENHLSSPTVGPGPAGNITQEAGTLSYLEICNYYQHFNHMFDGKIQCPYAWLNTTWIGYDNEDSIRWKVLYALSERFAGVMIWELGHDDFNNSCGRGRYPLLNAVHDTIKQFEAKEKRA